MRARERHSLEGRARRSPRVVGTTYARTTLRGDPGKSGREADAAERCRPRRHQRVYGNIAAEGLASTCCRAVVTLLGPNGRQGPRRWHHSGCCARATARAVEGDGSTGGVAPRVVRRGIAQSPEGGALRPRLKVDETGHVRVLRRKAGSPRQEPRFRAVPRLRERSPEGGRSGGEQRCWPWRAIRPDPAALLATVRGSHPCW